MFLLLWTQQRWARVCAKISFGRAPETPASDPHRRPWRFGEPASLRSQQHLALTQMTIARHCGSPLRTASGFRNQTIVS
jgi:hypothetical protein